VLNSEQSYNKIAVNESNCFGFEILILITKKISLNHKFNHHIIDGSFVSVCLSVILLWHLLCCTLEVPDLGVFFDSTGLRHVAAPPTTVQPVGGELRAGHQCYTHPSKFFSHHGAACGR